MNHRTVSKIARVLGIGGFAIVVAACAAPVGNESETASEEAVAVGCKNDNIYLVCPSGGLLGKTAFEEGLLAFGCEGKSVVEGSGPGRDAYYQTRCSLTAKATFACGSLCLHTRDGGLICSPQTKTGTVGDYVACHAGDAHLDAIAITTSACGCSLPAPSGDTYVQWDPTCSSGSCLPHYLD